VFREKRGFLLSIRKKKKREGWEEKRNGGQSACSHRMGGKGSPGEKGSNRGKEKKSDENANVNLVFSEREKGKRRIFIFIGGGKKGVGGGP